MEYTTINNNINEMKEVRAFFNELRSNFLRKERKIIRKKLYKNKQFIIF